MDELGWLSLGEVRYRAPFSAKNSIYELQIDIMSTRGCRYCWNRWRRWVDWRNWTARSLVKEKSCFCFHGPLIKQVGSVGRSISD